MIFFFDAILPAKLQLKLLILKKSKSGNMDDITNKKVAVDLDGDGKHDIKIDINIIGKNSF